MPCAANSLLPRLPTLNISPLWASTPVENVEELWAGMETWESGLNKITAKKFMADLSPAYVLRQLQKHMSILDPPLPSVAPGANVQNLSYLSLVGAWKTYLKWEESNPLRNRRGGKGRKRQGRGCNLCIARPRADAILLRDLVYGLRLDHLCQQGGRVVEFTETRYRDSRRACGI